jgi:hypothetical protein
MRYLRYEELPPISRQEFTAALADGTIEERSEALLRLALHDADIAFVEEACLRALDQQPGDVRRSSVLALGHLARIHHGVADDTVGRLRSLRGDPHLAGVVADALDDIRIYTSP